MAGVTDYYGSSDLTRVTDLDRKAAEARLRSAHTQGSLTLDELDERLVLLWQTKTRGDLTAITADLPTSALMQPPPDTPPTVKGNAGYQAMRVLTAIWLSVTAINFVVWLLVSVLTVELHYPWFLWTLLVPGSVLGVIWLMGFGRSRR